AHVPTGLHRRVRDPAQPGRHRLTNGARLASASAQGCHERDTGRVGRHTIDHYAMLQRQRLSRVHAHGTPLSPNLDPITTIAIRHPPARATGEVSGTLTALGGRTLLARL